MSTPAARFSPTHVRFFAAWALGVAAMLLLGVADGFGVLMLPSGLLLVWAGVSLGRDDEEWERYRQVASRQPGVIAIPGFVRWPVAGGLVVIGLGWTLGGVLSVLAIFGLYAFP